MLTDKMYASCRVGAHILANLRLSPDNACVNAQINQRERAFGS
jgi:hypothetical protein